MLSQIYVLLTAKAAGPVGFGRAMDDDAGALKARGEASGEPVDRMATANYVAELSAELAALARQSTHSGTSST